MLIPKKLKHRKVRRGSFGGIATKGFTVDFGDYGLKSLDRGWLTSRQLEAGRRAMTRYVKRGGKIWIRVFPARPRTKKPAEVGMGGGKGSLDHFVATVRPGTIIFEISGVDERTADEAMRLAAMKLPVRCRFVKATD